MRGPRAVIATAARLLVGHRSVRLVAAAELVGQRQARGVHVGLEVSLFVVAKGRGRCSSAGSMVRSHSKKPGSSGKVLNLMVSVFDWKLPAGVMSKALFAKLLRSRRA